MKVHLTDVVVQRLKAETQTTYWDASLPAFGLRVGRSRKTWVVMYGEHRARRTLGHYPTLSLAKAREEARKFLAFKPQFAPVSFAAAVDLFVETQKQRTRPRTWKEAERLLLRHFLPKLAKRPLGDVKTAEVLSVLDALLSTPSEANHAFTAVRQLFRWAASRGYCGPLAGLRPPARIRPRERVLTDAEIVKVWDAANPAQPFGRFVRLLIVTGQRRGETTALQPEWIGRHTVTFPREVTKNGRNHQFPIGPMARDLLIGLPFPRFQWHDEKQALDKAAGVHNWTLHDLRRTFATNLARLRVAPHVVEKLLNHITGIISGVAGIYNRFQYEKECREAINLWEESLQTLLVMRRAA
jgi:integrase